MPTLGSQPTGLAHLPSFLRTMQPPMSPWGRPANLTHSSLLELFQTLGQADDLGRNPRQHDVSWHIGPYLCRSIMIGWRKQI